MKIKLFSIGGKLNFAFLSVIFFTLLVGVMGLSQISMLAQLINQLYDHPFTVGTTVRDIRSDIDTIHDLLQRVPYITDPRELDEAELLANDIEARIYSKFGLLRERYLGDKEDIESCRRAFAGWKKLRDEEFRRARSEANQKLDKPFMISQQKFVDDLKAKTQKIIDFSSGKARSFISSAREDERGARMTMMILIVTALAISLGIAFSITRGLTVPLKIFVSRMQEISSGDMQGEMDLVRRDEIGELADSFREMQASLRNKVQVAMAIAAEDFSRVVEIRGPHDQLGNAIKDMTVALRKSKEENDRLDWIKTGKNELNQVIVGESDLNTLARKVISFLARYLQAQIGTLYLMSDQGTLTLSGSYALDLHKSRSDSISLGQGLVGQVAIEKDIISISDIPDDYIRINSSFGDSPPRNLVALPLIFEDQIKGVIELGSFEIFTNRKTEFLRDAAEFIAIAINTVQNHIKVRALLEETQRQAKQLHLQEEELRSSNEELEEQAAALRQSEERLTRQQEELQVVNAELEEKNDYLEQQKAMIAQKNQELEEAQTELELRARDLELTSKYKSEFLANMSHELRTPLNSLLILSRDLEDNITGNLNQGQVEAAKVIHKSGVDLLELINEILDLSRIEAGRMILKIGEVPLGELAEDIERSFKHVALDRGITFKTIVQADLPEKIRTDRQRLEQIIRNLVSNGLKFTEKGSVTVRFHRPGPETDLSRSALDPRRTVAMAIHDTGIGIPEDKYHLVFEPFRQVEGGTSRKHGGVGLGLSISRELAKLLGGEIQLESLPDRGSTFTLYIPEQLESQVREQGADLPVDSRITATPPQRKTGIRRGPEPAPEIVPDDRQTIDYSDKCILIIEDEPSFAKILLEQCHVKGYKALIAATGEAGLELTESHQPAAVILDLKLPGMNGWTVLQTLKANPATRHIPVHIMSGQEHSTDNLHQGAVGFLTKPAGREELNDAFKRIEQMMEKEVKDLLLVEDNARQRYSIVNLIGDMDVRIVEVENGAQALSALREKDFDCVVLDLGLPDMTGLELLSRLAEVKETRSIPVIIYTGRDLSRDEEKELMKYAESIIIKGVRSEERLLDEVALFLHKMVSVMPPRKREMIINLSDKNARLAGRTVLLVDDDMRNLFALSKILSDKGMKVLKAEDGQRALKVVAEHPEVDLVLLDIMMPVMDGYETIREIRKERPLHDLPIIALTARAMKEDQDKCIASGANDYLSKPVEIDRLLSMVRVWLYKRPECF